MLKFISLLLNQDVSHGLDVFISIIRGDCCLVPTRVGVIMSSSSTKSDSGVTGRTFVLIVTKDTDSCFGLTTGATHSVEPFLVTASLQRGLRANQKLPRVTTQ